MTKTLKNAIEILLLTAAMIYMAGMDFWAYLATGIIP